MADGNGNLYGTTASGGPYNVGTVFKLTPPAQPGSKWTKTLFYGFKKTSDGNYPNGSNPYAGLIVDGEGNLYGTTGGGGAFSEGTVFKLAPDGTETVLYSFKGWRNGDGQLPLAGLTIDSEGNLYGTTEMGGYLVNGIGCNCGTVFKIAPDGTYTILHSFAGGSDGTYPQAGVLVDLAGNVYGTTVQGGSAKQCITGTTGCGIVYKLAADGTETILHAFRGHADGGNPYSGLIADKSGNLYGTTRTGSDVTAGGTVFELAPDGTEKTLHAFSPKNNFASGDEPFTGLVADEAGNMFGTTAIGGTGGLGVVYEITPDGKETVLKSFNGGRGGGNLHAEVFIENGHLFGDADEGGRTNDCNGQGCGLVFMLDK